MSGEAAAQTRRESADVVRNAGRERGPTTLRSRLAEVFLATAQAAAGGRERITSEELSRHAGHSSTQVRRDLQAIGAQGTRGIGYDVRGLLARLEVASRGIDIAVLATPPAEVKEAYDLLCRAGVRLVISFGDQLLERRDGVAVHYAHSADRLFRAIALSGVPD
jgi:NADH/NAD ratio-sensing transcriptional regulator Rex